MKDFKEILLEKLKVSSNVNTNNYEYKTDYWNRDDFERLITFIIYDDTITDSFFDNNTEQKIPESCLTFYSEDEYGNDIGYNGLYNYNNGNNLNEIKFEQDDIEELFGALDYNDSINIYYYGNDAKTIIYEMYSDGSWYYSIFGDKEINKVINLFPDNLVQDENDTRSLLQAYEFYLKDN